MSDLATTPYLAASQPPTVTVQGGGGGGAAAFTDTFTLNVKAAESTAVPTDTVTFVLALAQSESNVVPTDTVKLGISGSGINESNVVPTDNRLITMKIWMSGGTATATGVTNVANSNGQNDGSSAVVQSAVLGTVNPSITSALGANIPSGLSLSSAVYRGFFRSDNFLITSNGKLTLRSIGALFVDIDMFTNAALNTTIDHLAGTFVFDLIAAGVNTQAKLQSIQMIHQTTDLAAGVTPHTLTVDAGCVEIVGAF